MNNCELIHHSAGRAIRLVNEDRFGGVKNRLRNIKIEMNIWRHFLRLSFSTSGMSTTSNTIYCDFHRMHCCCCRLYPWIGPNRNGAAGAITLLTGESSGRRGSCICKAGVERESIQLVVDYYFDVFMGGLPQPACLPQAPPQDYGRDSGWWRWCWWCYLTDGQLLVVLVDLFRGWYR